MLAKDPFCLFLIVIIIIAIPERLSPKSVCLVTPGIGHFPSSAELDAPLAALFDCSIHFLFYFENIVYHSAFLPKLLQKLLAILPFYLSFQLR